MLFRLAKSSPQGVQKEKMRYNIYTVQTYTLDIYIQISLSDRPKQTKYIQHLKETRDVDVFVKEGKVKENFQIWSIKFLKTHLRDNVTMFSGHKIVCYCNMPTVYSLWLLPYDTATLIFFFLSLKLLNCCMHCRCGEAKRLPRAQLWKIVIRSTCD